MEDIVSRLKDVSLLYASMGEELVSVLNADDSKDCRALVESILQHRDCLTRFKELNSYVLGLFRDLAQARPNLRADSQDELAALVNNLRQQVIRLNELCGIQAERLKSARDKLGRDLADLGRGALYLQSVKPSKSNYPKFIDSSY